MRNKRLYRVLIGSAIFTGALLLPISSEEILLVLLVISYITVGGDIILKAARNITKGQIFDENFLMSIATFGAFYIGEYHEGVAVMLFYQIGELFQSYAVNRSRRSIAELMDLRPDYANIERDGTMVKVDPYDVKIGDTIIIKAGEKVPLDSRILEGHSMVDTSSLTGESLPAEIGPGSELLSGCVNINGLLVAEVTKEYSESTVYKILELVEESGSRKSKSENFITEFARFYTPVVVIIAVLLAVLPPLTVPGANLNDWVYRALVFLVVSCPCALVISIPLSFFGGIGGASRKGILVKGSNYLEALAEAETVVFDKTGTLTKGVFNVHRIHGESVSEHELLEMAAYAESYSDHPISKSLKRAYGKHIDVSRIASVNELSGFGVDAVVEGKRIIAGNSRLMEKAGIACHMVNDHGTVIHVSIDSVYAGYIVITDELKNDAVEAVSKLKSEGVSKIAMLTGDKAEVAERVGGILGITDIYGDLLPGDKVKNLEELLSNKSKKGTLVFIGDGINDAPVLARADVGIAMGGLGSDAAIEAADIVIMNDEPAKIPEAIRVAKKTLGIAKQNAFFAIGIKIMVLVMGALGLTTLWAAVFADVGVTVLAILNALRALRV